MKNLRNLFPLTLCLLLVHLAIPSVCLGDNQEFGRTHPDLAARFANIKKIGLLPPGIRIYAVSAGGVVELRNDWTGQAKENVARAIRNLLGEKLVELKVPDEDRKLTEEIDDIEGLYSAIVLTIGSSGPYAFPAKDVSAYSLGPLHDICGRWNVDALLFAYGSDEISSGGRKALAVMIGAVGWEGATSLGIGLVDSEGSLLWFKGETIHAYYDLRDSDSAARFAEKTLSGFPGLGK
jgi:hypothetical protein